MTYDASNTRQIRQAQRDAKSSEVERLGVIGTTMSSPAGRNYIHSLLNRAHVFSSSFSRDALTMAFTEGERNLGLQILADVMSAAPEQYIQMMREAQEKELANDRHLSGGQQRNSSNNGRDDSALAGSVDSEYDPGLDTSDDPDAHRWR